MIDAIYFDGRSARRYPVTLIIHKRVVAMRGAGIRRNVRLSQLDISERLLHAPRILRFREGDFIEVSDPALDTMLAVNRYRDPWVVRWQQNWRLSLLALVSLLALLVAGYQWGLPWAADKTAQHLPASLEKTIGDEELKLIDAKYMTPSKLDPADQVRLQGMFSALIQPRAGKTAYRLVFRHSEVGPNAFALPNGVIVMTDQLVMLARDDQAVLGVLAHELGHLQRRHTVRGLMQTIGVGVVLNLFIGDVSSVLAAVPTFLLDQKYSRDFEREADQYAIDMLRANAVPLSPLAALFEKMRDADERGNQASSIHESADEPAGSTDDDEDEEEPPVAPGKGKAKRDIRSEFFSSHPSDDERIARLRAADR
jgi:Zn-dependent protease with chaperone function